MVANSIVKNYFSIVKNNMVNYLEYPDFSHTVNNIYIRIKSILYIIL